MRRWLVVLVGVLMVIPGVAMAQSSPLLDVMPENTIFDGDWNAFHYVPGIIGSEQGLDFLDGYGTFFGGPNGTRTQIVVLQNKPGRAAQNGAWEIVTGWVDRDIYSDEFDISYSSESDMDELPLPEGVADAKRVTGTDHFGDIPFCSGAFAIDPDLIAYIRVQGSVDLISPIEGGENVCDDLATVIASSYAEIVS
jgi:hypothetical protein